MEKNKQCYHYKKRVYTDGILNGAIDATYIIHLKDNGREPDIEKQLSEYHPTNTVYIVINKGYKTCPKNLPDQTPPHDLTDAFLQIFQHANKENYNHILILEDDFLFHPNIKDPTIQRDVCEFLQTKRTYKCVYYLGCLPYIQSMGLSNHNRLYMSIGTHACVYSKPLRNHILESYAQTDIVDWDLFHNCNSFRYPRYIYSQPLCYQLFPPTENAKHWYNPLGLADIIKYFHKKFDLDKQVEPGHQYFYGLSKFIYVFILVLLTLSAAFTLKWLVTPGRGVQKQRK